MVKKIFWRLRGGADANERQGRTPGRWWWVKVISSVLLMTWRTVILLLTWHH